MTNNSNVENLMPMCGDTATVYSVEYHCRRRVWKFPDDKFVQYEKSDEAWARPLGFGEEVEIVETVTIPRAVCVGFYDGALQLKALDCTDSEILFFQGVPE